MAHLALVQKIGRIVPVLIALILVGCAARRSPPPLTLHVDCPPAFELGLSGTLTISVTNQTSGELSARLRVRLANYLTSASPAQVFCEHDLLLDPAETFTTDCLIRANAIEGSTLVQVEVLVDHKRHRATCNAP